MARISPKIVQARRLAEELKAAHPGRPGVELYEIIARLWVQEKAELGKAPFLSIRALGLALGLSDIECQQRLAAAQHSMERARRAHLGFSIHRRGNLSRFVTADSKLVEG